jgi:hypothetical protein
VVLLLRADAAHAAGGMDYDYEGCVRVREPLPRPPQHDDFHLLTTNASGLGGADITPGHREHGRTLATRLLILVQCDRL